MNTQLIGSESLTNQCQPVSPKLMLEFVKALVQETHNSDVFIIAIMRAQRASGASDEEVQILSDAVKAESEKNRVYPDGFMP